MGKSRLVLVIVVFLCFALLTPINYVEADSKATFNAIRPIQAYEKGTTTINNPIQGLVNIIEVKIQPEVLMNLGQDAELKMTLPEGVTAVVRTQDPEDPEMTTDPIIDNSYLYDETSRLPVITGQTPQNISRFYIQTYPNAIELVSHIYIYYMSIPENYNATEVKATFEIQNYKVSIQESEHIANVTGGHIAAKMLDDDLITTLNKNNYINSIRFDENFAGAVEDVKLSLPEGFYFDTEIKKGAIIPNKGFSRTEEQEITFSYTDFKEHRHQEAQTVILPFSLLRSLEMNEVSSWDLLMGTAMDGLRIIVDDRTAKLGDIIIESDKLLDGKLNIGRYGLANANTDIIYATKLTTGTTGTLGIFEVKENRANALQKDTNIKLTLPKGVQWVEDSLEGKYGPTLGEETINNGLTFASQTNQVVWKIIDEDNRTIEATITNPSSRDEDPKGAQLLFKDALVKVDKDFVGDINVVVRGTAGATGVVKLATVTEAVEEIEEAIQEEIEKQGIVFKVGSPTYTVNSNNNLASIIPYIKDGRTFLGVKDVAMAIGIEEDNIRWYSDARIVTIIKEDRIVQLEIGNPFIKVNGMDYPTDAMPEIKEGRTTLPIAHIMQALDIDYKWDNTTQTVTIEK